MKKNILIIILIFIVAYTMLFAFIKASEREKYSEMASLAQQEAEKMFAEAMKQQELALEAAAEAKRQQALAEEAMAMYMVCNNK